MDDEKKEYVRRNLKGYHPVPKLNKLDPNKAHRTMMVIGATGTGKTTTLNCMMNYLWGVDFKDEYRYKLIFEKEKEKGQADSQTDNVTAYNLEPPALGYQLTVIDTPGYGDTRGIERDKLITKNIKEFFDKEVQDIDAVCFVIRAPQARLTATQKYIFSQVLNIFGKDIKDNIFILLTFADGKKPPALEALKAGNVPCKKYFKYNNSAFDLQTGSSGGGDDGDSSDDEDDLASMLWKTSMKSFKKLFKKINQAETKSLSLTKQVLQRRKELECYVENIQPTINAGFTVLEDMRGQIIQLEKCKDLVNANKDFMLKRTVAVATQVSNGGGCTTTCPRCNYTCHKNCGIPDDKAKDGCCAMGSDGNCRSCPDKCHWSLHRNLPYTVEWKNEIKEEPIQDLKDKYYDAKNKQQTVQQQLNKALDDEIATITKDLYNLINSVRSCIVDLGNIALRPNPLSQADYIDKLIQSEQDGKQPGWQARIKSLKTLKEQQKILSDVAAAEFNPFEKYADVTDFVDKNKEILSSPKQEKNKGKNKGKKKHKKGVSVSIFGYTFQAKKT